MVRTIVILVLVSLIVVLIYTVHPREAESITWGVGFSVKQAEKLGLEWRTVYLAILDDLGVDNVRIAAHWDKLEPQDQMFAFQDLDWQMQQAAERGADVILAVGMKTPRWPECHIPDWARDLSNEDLQSQVLEMLESVVERYKNHEALRAWQVENEPLLRFGECPFRDVSFLEREVELVRSLDSEHEVITSDSGELSTWFHLARRVDALAVTQYHQVWSAEFNNYISMPIPASLYATKAWLVDRLLGKRVFIGELQAEPWVEGELEETSVEDTEKIFGVNRLRRNLQFARNTGLDAFYLWGAEWWYYMQQHGSNEFWEEAKQLFAE